MSRVFSSIPRVFIGISSEVVYRALRSLNVMHSRRPCLQFPPQNGDRSVTDTGGCALVVWTGHMIRLSTCVHTECGTAHSTRPNHSRIGPGKGFLSKGSFHPGRNSGQQSGEAFSRLLQGPSPAVHTNHTGQSSGEVKSIPHQVGQATGERSREVNRHQRSVEFR